MAGTTAPGGRGTALARADARAAGTRFCSNLERIELIDAVLIIVTELAEGIWKTVLKPIVGGPPRHPPDELLVTCGTPPTRWIS